MTNKLPLVSVIIVALAAIACGDKSSPTAPSNTSQPPAPTVSLTGSVSSQAGAKLPGATVTIQDGPNAGKSTVTDTSGNYTFSALTFGNGNVGASAAGYLDDVRGVVINGSNTLSFTLKTVLPWTMSGQGNNVIDKPSYITRVRIQGRFSGFSSNFIVWCGNSLVVNELLGTGWGPTTYDGTHNVPAACSLETRSSSGVSWTYTEVR